MALAAGHDWPSFRMSVPSVPFSLFSPCPRSSELLLFASRLTRVVRVRAATLRLKGIYSVLVLRQFQSQTLIQDRYCKYMPTTWYK